MAVRAGETGGPSGPLWQAPASRRFDVVGVGECSLDHVCLLDQMPRPGAKIDLAGYLARPGGQVATTVLGCARLGLRCAYVGAVGDDAAAGRVLAPLADAGIEIEHVVRIASVPTRMAVVLVDRGSGERTVLGYRDPRLTLEPSDLDPALLRETRVLHLDARDPELAAWAAREAQRAGVAVVLDADALWRRPEELLRHVDFPLVSRSLAEELGGTGRVRDGLRVLASFGARLAAVTLGEHGALAIGPDRREIRSPGFRVKPRDTTGAGDAFHAGFISALLAGHAAEEVLRVSHAVAALNCQALGAQEGLPEPEELQRFLRTRQPESWRDPD